MEATTSIRELSDKNKRLLKASRKRFESVDKNPMCPDAKTANWAKAFFEIYADEPLRKRQALSFAYALRQEPIRIFEGQLVGHIYNQNGSYWYPRRPDVSDIHPDAREYDPFYVSLKRVERELPDMFRDDGFESAEEVMRRGGGYWFPVQSAPGHIGWRWDWIVEAGFSGLLERIEKAIATADEKGCEELACMRIFVEAALKWAESHADVMSAMLEVEENEQRKATLEKRLEICERVPRYGARNFDEAVQAFHFAYMLGLYDCHYGGNSPGPLDYYLWPYLEKDLANGSRTLEDAGDLIEELFIMFNERIGHGEETIVVGGCHADGACAANPLSRIIVESILTLNEFLRPSVYVRIAEDAPEWLWELSARFLVSGGNRAQAVNDEAIVKAIIADGHVSVEDAREYMCGGCMEISPFGMNGDLLFTGFLNVGKIFELVLTGGECLLTGDLIAPHLLREKLAFDSFEELYQAFLSELRRRLELSFKRIDILSEELVRFRPAHLLSAMIADCIENGRVINDGGARYEDYGSTPMGMPNVADSLTAVKKAVFDDAYITIDELVDTLRDNFSGSEELLERLGAIPKYGQGDVEADGMMSRLVEDVCAIYSDYENRLGGRIKPMIMTFSVAPSIGASLGAMPDGRLSGTPISHGITPQARAMNQGISTAMRSTTSVPLDLFSGGASHMWDIDESLATNDIVKSILKVFFQNGGQMFQGNTLSADQLKKALKEPESHRGMTVRVGGFSAFFLQLSSEVQEEIINRHHHKN